MQPYLTLTRRELGSLFVSFAGYVIIAGAVFLMGFSFVALIVLLQGQTTLMPATRVFFSTSYFWDILVVASPLITMRLFALEKSSGTFETLMTAPVSDLQVVLAKFTAAMIFYLILWLPPFGSILILRHYMSQPDVFDAGLMASTYFGIFLLGGLFMSMGCLASALTRNQIVAAIISFTLGYSLLVLSYLPGKIHLHPAWLEDVIAYMALPDHMNDFARGLVDTRHVIFYVSLTFLFLFLTLRVVQSRRWK